MRRSFILLFLAATTLSACSSTVHGTGTDPDSVPFVAEPTAESAAPAESTYVAPTEARIIGTWASRTHRGHDVRVRFTADTIEITTWCGDGEVSKVVADGQVTESMIAIFESKASESGGACGARVGVEFISRCTPYAKDCCFEISGSTLTFVSKSLFSSGGTAHDAPFEKVLAQ